jgi:sugar phosphate isomerase/epimerase
MLYQDYLPGFISIGINPEIGFDGIALDEYMFNEFFEVAEQLRDHGLMINLHAPFMDLSPGSPDPCIRNLTPQPFHRMPELASLYGAKRIIVHGGYDRKRYGYMKKYWIQKAVETWSWLAKSLRDTGSILTLEYVFEDRPEDMLPLFKALEGQGVGFCLYTGHQAAYSSTPLSKWVTKLWPFLQHLHLHDNRGEEDEHLAMGQGDIDFRALFKKVKAKMMSPPAITLEPHKEGDLLPSLEYLHKI